MLRLNKLTARRVTAKALRPGRYGDGGGLYLSVTPAGARRWTFLYRNRETGRQHELFLGSTHTVSLVEARSKALELRKALLDGEDPLAARMAAKAARKALAARKTFGQVADAYLASPNVTKFRNAKHRQQWASSLGAPCADLRRRFVDEITTEDVIRTLHPVFDRTPETGRRLQGRIETVLGYATVSGLRSGENPARWEHHLETHFVARSALEKGQHAAMRWQDVAGFYAGLPDTIPALALRFLILTATRASEALGATWDEIFLDGTSSMWTIPSRRMKRARQHEIPLPAAAVALLDRAAEFRAGALVFPGRSAGKPISDFAVRTLLAGREATIHGFRSSFRTWAGDVGIRRELAEICLAHAFGDAVERAYMRSNFISERREVMTRWAGVVIGTGL